LQEVPQAHIAKKTGIKQVEGYAAERKKQHHGQQAGCQYKIIVSGEEGAVVYHFCFFYLLFKAPNVLKYLESHPQALARSAAGQYNFRKMCIFVARKTHVMKSFFTLILLPAAMTVLWAQNIPEAFTYEVGSMTVTLLQENEGTTGTGVLVGASSEILQQYAPEGACPSAINAFLVYKWGQLSLIDAGLGTRLFDNLKAAGVVPENISNVLLTHMHGDHIGGLLLDGKVAFPNAQLFVPQPEYDYWTSDEEMFRLPENRRGGFVQARRVLEAYGNKVQVFVPAATVDEATSVELLPGFFAVAAYGHTPGHTMYLLQSDKERLLIWGDLTHVMAVQMPHPEIAVSYDVNPAQAADSRRDILALVAQQALPVAGMHVPFPAMGRVRATGQGAYRFQKAVVPGAVQEAVRKQLQRYPALRLQDLYKSFFQDYFGPGHSIANEESAANYLRSEMESMHESQAPEVEPTGWEGNFYRINLSVLKTNKVPFEVLLAAFIESANETLVPQVEEWRKEWQTIVQVIDNMALSIPDYEADKQQIEALLAAGHYAVHHSEAYRQHYAPHYRIISQAVFKRMLQPYFQEAGEE
jgi:glyoxylase-like metal-dependent hydrolase (beta-lactamase superfamily II)